MAHVVLDTLDAMYIGQINSKSQPHGTGRLSYKNDGSCYTGTWLEGHWHGQGKFVAPSGEICEGEWELGIFSGEGRLSQPNGAIFDGKFLSLTEMLIIIS